MPNGFAYLMLALWPLVVMVMFRKMPIERALIWSILGGYLLLPPSQANLNLPMIPALDKVSIPNIMALIGCAFIAGQRIEPVPHSWLARLLLVILIVAPVATVLNNSEAIRFAVQEFQMLEFVSPQGVEIPGLRPYDTFATVASQVIFLLPFLLARQFLATPRALRELLVALMIGGLVYSLPMLVEVRLSPQLNTWIYGFFQHSFAQMIRGDGFRPIVFLPHGLWLALFTMMAMFAAMALARATAPQERTALIVATLWLAVMLVLCRSVGPMLIAAGLLPLMLLAPSRVQLGVAALIGLVVLIYPLLRGSGMFPLETVLQWSEMFGAERAQSFRFRLENEEILLARAAEKPLFGWGTWGRNHVYDPMTGDMLSITDGHWIIVIGSFGWTGYLAQFGLLALPLVMLFLRFPARPASLAGPVALLLAANLFDLLPNATLVPLTWLLAGALLGHAEALRTQDRHNPITGHETMAQPATRRRSRTIL